MCVYYFFINFLSVPTALSVEEQRLMQSLERLNERLQGMRFNHLLHIILLFDLLTTLDIYDGNYVQVF